MGLVRNCGPELPPCVLAGLRHARIINAHTGVDRKAWPDPKPFVERMETPETDAHPVFVPAPIGHVRQLGDPVGGASTCRGIAREMSQTSMFTIVQTMMRSPFGKRSFGRSTIASISHVRWATPSHTPPSQELLRTPDACASCTEMTRRSVPNSLACCQRGFTWRQFEFSAVLCDLPIVLSEFNTEDEERPQSALRVCLENDKNRRRTK